MISFKAGETKKLKVTFKDELENVTPLTAAVQWSGPNVNPPFLEFTPTGEADTVFVKALKLGTGNVTAKMSTGFMQEVVVDAAFEITPGVPTHGEIVVVV